MDIKKLVVAYPSGNTTALVYDPLLHADLKQLNAAILTSWKNQRGEPEIEQCCFLQPAQDPQAIGRVHMFGGEFCGNATRAGVWVLTEGRDSEGLIEVSGAQRLLEFNVRKGQVSVEMPIPAPFFKPVTEGTLVFLEGITHLVVAEPKGKDPRQIWASLRERNTYGCLDSPAFGVTFFDQATQKAKFCVWVKSVGTLFDETACGSGTCAIGLALASQIKNSIRQKVIQPSGDFIETAIDYRQGKTKAFISGRVKVLYAGELKLQ